MLTTIATLKALAHCTTADDSRYFLNGVHVSSLPDGQTRVQATTGHVALRVDHDPPVPPEDIPVGCEHHAATGAAYVSADAIKAIAAGKIDRNLTTLTSAVAVMPENGTPASVARWNYGWTTRPAGGNQDATFPNLDRVLPTDDTHPLSVVLAVDVLEQLCKAAKTLKARGATIRFTFKREDQSITDPWGHGRPVSEHHYTETIGVHMTADDGATVTGAAMPMRQ